MVTTEPQDETATAQPGGLTQDELVTVADLVSRLQQKVRALDAAMTRVEAKFGLVPAAQAT